MINWAQTSWKKTRGRGDYYGFGSGGACLRARLPSSFSSPFSSLAELPDDGDKPRLLSSSFCAASPTKAEASAAVGQVLTVSFHGTGKAGAWQWFKGSREPARWKGWEPSGIPCGGSASSRRVGLAFSVPPLTPCGPLLLRLFDVHLIVAFLPPHPSLPHPSWEANGWAEAGAEPCALTSLFTARQTFLCCASAMCRELTDFLFVQARLKNGLNNIRSICVSVTLQEMDRA